MDAVRQVLSLYVDGRLKDAEFAALRALQNPEDLAQVDRAELHRVLGFVYVAQGNNEKAKKQFLNWLEQDPLAELDPLYISPKIRNVFNRAREEFILRQTEEPPPDYKKMNLKIEAAQRSLIFPGLGQIYRGQQVKGFSLLASEIVVLGSLAYFQVNYERSRDDYLNETDPARMQNLYDDYNLYYRARTVSIALAFGIYVYSILDALYFPPHNDTGQGNLTISVSPIPANLITISFHPPGF